MRTKKYRNVSAALLITVVIFAGRQTQAQQTTRSANLSGRVEDAGDAVLTPFNMSDITHQSDMRGHKFAFGYTVDPRMLFVVTGILTQRAHGLLGPFLPTSLGSTNRATTRLQLDTVLRF